MSDAQIRAVTQSFVAELRKLHERAAWPKYKKIEMTLKVTYSPDEGGKFELACATEWSNSVKATNLGRLMDEVWRRNDFDGREQARIDQLAIEAPKGDDFGLTEEPVRAADDKVSF